MKFSRKEFIANAEAFIEERRAAWVRDIIGTPLEPHALAYAKREFILPNEDLNCVTANDLFPNADLGEWVMKIEKGMASREEASKAIRVAVVDGLREVNAGVERVRMGVAEPLAAIPATLPAEKASAAPALKSPIAEEAVRLQGMKHGDDSKYCGPIEEWAEGFDNDANQCNRTCRLFPTIGRRLDRWFAFCMCGQVDGPDAITAYALWQQYNPVRRLKTRAELSEMRRLNKESK